jgi:formylglycine-generating enzyme required for sulfatase activity
LADRASLWKERRENRHLPSLWEFLNIRLLTDRPRWSDPQRKMMSTAGRLNGIRCGIAAAVVVLLALCAHTISRLVEEAGRPQYAAYLVDRLVTSNISQVPDIVTQLDTYRRWADPILRQKDASAIPLSQTKLHLALGLLPVDVRKIVELRDELPLVSPSEFVVVRDALLPYREKVADPLWKLALDPSGDKQQRFQAACALATYSPDDQRWSQIDTFVAGRLVTLDGPALVAWRAALRPAKRRLVKSLASIYRDPSALGQFRLHLPVEEWSQMTDFEKQQSHGDVTDKEPSRINATEALADYTADKPEEIFDLLADADEFQFEIMFGKLTAYKDKAVALAYEELARKPQDSMGEYQKDILAKRQANAALALLRLGRPDKIWPLLKFSPDPRVRSSLIHWLGPLWGDPQLIVQRFDDEPDVTIRRALVLILGGFTESQLSAHQREPLIDKLLTVYENESDAGLHSAVEWLLRKWGQAERLAALVEHLKSDEQQLLTRKVNKKRRWYVNTQKQTFVIVDAGEFLMGSPKSELHRSPDEAQHRRRIGRRFAIATTEVTKEQFERFQAARPEIAGMDTGQSIETKDLPQVGITWYEAAAYCDWLSEQEGIPKDQWCYERNRQGHYAAGMRAKDKFWKLIGYRLPTEAEWEYACRANTVTSRYYGLSDTLLWKYAVYHFPHRVALSDIGRRTLKEDEEQAAPVARLKPNDLGLFDMHGNATEWCFDLFVDYPQRTDKVFEDTPTTQPVEAGGDRALRGGAFYYPAADIRSAYRLNGRPNDRASSLGFRPARTYP